MKGLGMDKPDELLEGTWFVATRLDVDILGLEYDIHEPFLCFRRISGVCGVPIAPTRSLSQAQFDDVMLSQPPINRSTLHYLGGVWLHTETAWQALFREKLLAKAVQTILDHVFVDHWGHWDYQVRSEYYRQRYV